MPAAAAVAITHCGLLAGTPPAAHGRASAFVAPVPAGGLAAAARRGVVFPLGDARPMPAVVSGCHRHSRAVAPRVPPSRRSVVGPVMALDNPPAALRELLTSPTCLLMPCAYDALSARLVARAGFPLTFMSGFSVAASLGLPDTGLLGYAEVEARLRSMTTAVDIPIICDADTGYGGVANVVRTVRGLAAAGAAGLMLEDQVWPKRCGHTKGKAVVDRETAFLRVKAAVDASRSLGDRGPVIVARTDAARFSMDEALTRVRLFAEAGAEVTFVEAPRSRAELAAVGAATDGPKLANMLEEGQTPLLSAGELGALGFTIAAYPLTLVSAAIRAMEAALAALAAGGGDTPEGRALLSSFAHVQDVAGFNDFYALEDHYAGLGERARALSPPPDKLADVRDSEV